MNEAESTHRAALAAFQAGRHDEALKLMQRSIELAPRSAVFESNFGTLCRMLGRADDAIAHWQRAIELDANEIDAHINLAAALRERHEPDSALIHARRAMALAPDRPEAHINFAAALSAVGQLDEAEAALRAMLNRFPRHPQALAELGNVLKTTGRFEGAVEMWRQCVQIEPRYAQAWNNIGAALMEMGQPEEGVDAYQKAVDADPGFAAAHSSLAMSTHFDSRHDAASVLAANREWERRHAAPLRSAIRPHTNDRDLHRRLRIGYVSPDLRRHSVGRAMLPLISNHDASQFEIVCYSDATERDDLTAELRRHSHVWHDTAALSHADLADKIRADRVDILIDLTQHMANNRMLVFARKPAPVQASFIAYPATTGVAAIDYRITDPILDPPPAVSAVEPPAVSEVEPGESDRFNSEKLIRLSRTFYCYRGEPIDPAPLAASRTNSLTFASLSSLFKISPAALELWSQVLRAVPSSRLLVPAPLAATDRFIERLQHHGIDPSHLDLLPRQPFLQYLRAYDRVDIALDTIPYNGGVTTCDAIWMGAPVVTLRGETSVARAGESILSSLDLRQWVASSPEEFVRIAAQLAADPAQLAQLRRSLRPRMLQSPICDEAGFTREVENAYRQMWRNWCTSR